MASTLVDTVGNRIQVRLLLYLLLGEKRIKEVGVTDHGVESGDISAFLSMIPPPQSWGIPGSEGETLSEMVRREYTELAIGADDIPLKSDNFNEWVEVWASRFPEQEGCTSCFPGQDGWVFIQLP